MKGREGRNGKQRGAKGSEGEQTGSEWEQTGSEGSEQGAMGGKGSECISILGFRVPTTCGRKNFDDHI